MIHRAGRLLSVPTKEAKAYVELAYLLTKQALGAPAPQGKLVVDAWYYWGDKRRHDTDNSRKLLADALAKGLKVDDSVFLWRDQNTTVDREDPRVELEVYPYES